MVKLVIMLINLMYMVKKIKIVKNVIQKSKKQRLLGEELTFVYVKNLFKENVLKNIIYLLLNLSDMSVIYE